ncbi:RNB-domain-containing protein [Dacryopinax primogenitus]|uniref:RNB-domain-containing protein n=1 Tax=Dacryopinax primogenitus (strain DJM 731) TaxID=1858805 RepID=M5GG72_DACPD|nr:RNB-domain-containing protein [Dacryopinax primogenitus]EJU04983.1 RNB-domain-containing protein [Dacryopinax primogenitus]
MNCVAGPSRAVARRQSSALRHYTSSAATQTAPKPNPGKYAAFLPADHPDAHDSNSTARRILAAATHGRSGTWGYRPAYDRGMQQQMTLEELARQGQSRPHPEQLEFEEAVPSGLEVNGDGSLDDDSLDAIPLGSILELRRGGCSYHGCLLGRAVVPMTGRPVMRTITPAGFLLSHNLHDVFFTVPEYFPKQLVLGCGADDSPKTRVQENSRLAIIRRLLELTKDVERQSNQIRSRANRLHELFRSKDPDGWSALSVVDAARFIDGTNPDRIPSTRTIFATHKYMFSNELQFQVDPLRHRVSQTYSVRPLNDVNAVRDVKNWALSNTEHIPRFIDKAHTIINASRALRRVFGPIEPISTPDLPKLNEDDQKIIRALQVYAERTRYLQQDPVDVLAQVIIGQIGLYGKLSTDARDIVSTFLQELGVITPWKDLTENRILVPRRTQQQQDAFEADGKRMLELHDTELKKRETGSKDEKRLSEVLTTTDFCPDDDCAHIRHDFGQLPVFVIDQVDAQELDDGLSVEVIPGSTDVWLHVHVADPTRLLHPDNVFSREARNRAETIYLVEQTIPMLPRSLAMAGMTLEPGNPLCTLTFSARVSEDGDMTDLRVQAGVIRNVVRITYNQVDALLGYTPKPKSEILKALSTAPVSATPDAPPADVSVDIIKLLYATTEKVKRRRLNRDFFARGDATLTATVYPSTLPTNVRVPDQPHLWHGFPKFDLNLEALSSMGPGQSLVQESMIAAGRIAGRWAYERGIPLIYRTAQSPIAPTAEAVAEALDLRDAHNIVASTELTRLGISNVGARNASEPGRHFPLGISHLEGGYARVTSPLRRYSDLVNHWMLKSALRVPNLTSLPFDRETVTVIAQEMNYRSRMLHKQEVANQLLWTMRALNQALVTDENPVAKEMLQGSVRGIVSNMVVSDGRHLVQSMEVYLPDLGLRGSMQSLSQDELKDVWPGAERQFRITEVRLSGTPFMGCEFVG